MGAVRHLGAGRAAPLFEFESLEQLQCGCVTASYRSRRWDVTLVTVEAQGLFCLVAGHRPGQIVRLGEPVDLAYDAEEV